MLRHHVDRPLDLANIIQAFGIDIFERDRAGVQEFESIIWNLNDPLTGALREAQDTLEHETFDLINSRFLTDGIDKERWESLTQEYKKWLKPGGWLQMAEVQWTFHSQSGQELPNLSRWSKAYSDALKGMHKDPDITTPKDPDITTSRLEKHVRWAGFELVSAQVHDILLGDWHPGTCHAHVITFLSLWLLETDRLLEVLDEDNGDSGSAGMRYVHGILESFAMVPFTRQLEWSLEETMQVVRAAQTELRIPDAKISFKL